MNRSTPGLPVHHQLPEFTQTHARRVGDAIQPSHRPLLLLPPIPPSIRVFSNESTLQMSWPKYWSFSFSISPSSEHLGVGKLSVKSQIVTLLGFTDHTVLVTTTQLYCCKRKAPTDIKEWSWLFPNKTTQTGRKPWFAYPSLVSAVANVWQYLLSFFSAI